MCILYPLLFLHQNIRRHYVMTKRKWIWKKKGYQWRRSDKRVQTSVRELSVRDGIKNMYDFWKISKDPVAMLNLLYAFFHHSHFLSFFISTVLLGMLLWLSLLLHWTKYSFPDLKNCIIDRETSDCHFYTIYTEV